MRNAALVLGLIAGVFGMIVGFFGYGYTVAIEQWGEIEGWARQVDNVELIRAASFFAPMLCIAGGAMARARALWGGALMLLSAAGFYYAFGFTAGKPDEEKAHF